MPADRYALSCPCECHGHGPGHPCSVQSGCGHLHRAGARPAGAAGPRCRRGRRCAHRTGSLAAPVDVPGLCGRDQQLLMVALRGLPEVHDELTSVEMLTPAATGTGLGGGRGSTTPPLPLRVGHLALADEIHDELDTWEHLVRDRAGMAPTQGRVRDQRWRAEPARRVVHRAAGLLADQLPAFLAIGATPMSRWSRGTTRAGEHRWLVEADGYTGAVRLLELHAHGEALIGYTRLVTHLKGKTCPGCHAETLQLVSGEGRARCTSCRDRWEEHEYDFLARVLNGEQRAPRTHPRRVWSSEPA